jgi:hypothetical protein
LKGLTAGFILSFITLFSLSASDPYLSLTLDINYSALGFATMMKPYAEDKLVIPQGYDEIREEAIQLLLEDARWIFSGMIYGFTFRYVPGNSEETFDEVFELTPVSQIHKGDPAMKVQQVLDDTQFLMVLFHYWPDDYQNRRIRISQGGGFQSSAAVGGVPMMLEDARTLSLKEAVKQALRSDLRAVIFNRPLEVTGSVYLSGPPVISIRAGEYTSRVKILYRREDLKTFPANY